jgi:hypothetical protein
MRMLENSRREEGYLREQIKKLETDNAATTGPARVSDVPLLTKKDAA